MVKRIELEVNGEKYPVHSDADTPLLFVLREEIGLTGTKYGCGQCGTSAGMLRAVPRIHADVSFTLKVKKYFLSAFFRAQIAGVDHDFGIGRLFVGV